MTVEYYHLSPVILTDVLWATYNSNCPASGTVAQRTAAYQIAEQQMVNHLGAFLEPTTITGSFPWPATPEPIMLPYKYVRSIDRIVVESIDGYCNCDVTENTACGFILNNVGYINVRVTGGAAAGCGGCGTPLNNLYMIIVTWTAGFPAAVGAGDANLHMALAIMADEILTQIVDPGAGQGGPGAPGVKGFSTLGYSETFVESKHPQGILGNTQRANLAKTLVAYLKKKPALRF